MSFVARTQILNRILIASKNTAEFSFKSPLNLRQASSVALAQDAVQPKWDLVSSVCLERKPIISADLNEVETKMQTLLNKLEFENSIKSDHELRQQKDKATMEAVKAGSASEADLEQATKATAQDFEDSSLEQLSKFKFASRIGTNSDADVKNCDRLMASHLILLVKQKFGSEDHWVLPQTTRRDDETMRQAAERALAETAGPKLNSLMLGNAPVGFYKYKYPKNIRDKNGVEGAKVFFFKALYKGGDVESKDYMWATKEETEKNVADKYYESVYQFLFFQ